MITGLGGWIGGRLLSGASVGEGVVGVLEGVAAFLVGLVEDGLPLFVDVDRPQVRPDVGIAGV